MSTWNPIHSALEPPWNFRQAKGVPTTTKNKSVTHMADIPPSPLAMKSKSSTYVSWQLLRLAKSEWAHLVTAANNLVKW